MFVLAVGAGFVVLDEEVMVTGISILSSSTGRVGLTSCVGFR